MCEGLLNFHQSVPYYVPSVCPTCRDKGILFCTVLPNLVLEEREVMLPCNIIEERSVAHCTLTGSMINTVVSQNQGHSLVLVQPIASSGGMQLHGGYAWEGCTEAVHGSGAGE